MTLMLEENTRTVYLLEGVCARTGVNWLPYGVRKLKVKMHNAENGKLERLFFFLAGDTKEKADNRQQIWEICLKN